MSYSIKPKPPVVKQAIIFMALIAIASNSFCQQTTTSQPLTKEDYLTKSKHQKTIAWVMLGGGIALAVGGAIWAGSNWDSSGPDVLFVVAGASLIGSVPLFIAAGKNKRKAMSASANFKMETVPVIQHTILARKSYPTLSLNISL